MNLTILSQLSVHLFMGRASMEDHQDLENSAPVEEAPQVFNIIKEGKHIQFTRREFIKAASVVTGAATLVGCGPGGSGFGGLGPRQEAEDVLPTAAQEPTDPPVPTNTSKPKPTLTPTKKPTNTPKPTQTSTPTAIAVTCKTRTNGARFRAGPATYYQMMDGVKSGTLVTAIGRLADSSWLKVLVKVDDLPTLKNAPIAEGKTEVAGWFRADLLEVLTGDVSLLPVEEPPLTPTPLPNEKPTGDEGITYKYTDLYGNTYTYTLPCGSPIPEGAVCTCNCVTLCSCDGYVAPCGCDSDSGGSYCTCNMVVYWYPN